MKDFKIKLETEQFKKILDVSKKGLGNGKVLPITEFIELLFSANTLYITTTNLNTWVICELQIDTNLEEGEEVSIVVEGKKLVQLVNKTTVDYITLEVGTDALSFKGNGKYTLPILSEDFPNFEFEVRESYKVKTKDLIEAIEVGKNSLAKDDIMPCLTAYRISDKVITTDSIKMTVNNTNLLDTELLLPAEIANLVNTLSSEYTTFEIGDENIMLSSDNVKIFGSVQEGIESYPKVDFLLQEEFDGQVELYVKNFKAALNRLNIFNDVLSKDGVVLRFEEDFLTLESSKGNNKELIPYTKKINFVEGQKVMLNLEYLLQLLSSIKSETFILNYGNDNMVKLESGNEEHYLCKIHDN